MWPGTPSNSRRRSAHFYQDFPVLTEADREKRTFLLWMTDYFRAQLERTLARAGHRSARVHVIAAAHDYNESIHDKSEFLWRRGQAHGRRPGVRDLSPRGAGESGVAKLSRIPYSIKILLENLLRFEDGATVKASDIEYVAEWDIRRPPQEINFRPARVLLQDFTGVPCVVDLAAMRDALRARWAPIPRRPIR